MMNNNFISGNLNLDQADENKFDLNIPSTTIEDFSHDVCLSNSFGFGGTNACLALGKYFD